MILDSRSLTRLSDVHVDLQRVISEAAATWNGEQWIITEGLRSLARQKELVRLKKSQTMKSRHLTGHAIDFAVKDGEAITWEMKYYRKVAEHILATAKKMKISLEWGGNWKTLKDGPHIQLSWKDYP